VRASIFDEPLLCLPITDGFAFRKFSKLDLKESNFALQCKLEVKELP